MNNKKNLGIVYTPKNIAMDMIQLAVPKITDIIFEPSVGNGIFIFSLLEYIQQTFNLSNIQLKNYFINKIYFQDINEKNINILIEKIKKYFAKLGINNIEIKNYIIGNTLEKTFNKKFDIIIGNPPYIKHKNIINKEILNNYKIFNKNSNLYMYFLYKSINLLKENGKLIFLTPPDFFKMTSAKQLNNFIYQKGTITNIKYLKENIFKNVKLSTIIWKFENNNYSYITNNNQQMKYYNGYLLFLKNNYTIKFSDLFYVKVGAASGCDDCFKNKNGIDFVNSTTKKTGKTIKMLYNTFHPDLLKYKNKLLNRKIKKFNEKNWYMYGRNYYKSDKPRIYVNNKTRLNNPFFINNVKAYNGSILAIFFKFEYDNKTILQICNELNKVNWKELGFLINNRYIFNQKSLENSLLPNFFNKFKN